MSFLLKCTKCNKDQSTNHHNDPYLCQFMFTKGLMFFLTHLVCAMGRANVVG